MVLVSNGIACRAANGEMPSNCLMNADGSGPLLLSSGFNDRGSAQSLWVRNSRPGDSFEEGHQPGAADRISLCQIGDPSP